MSLYPGGRLKTGGELKWDFTVCPCAFFLKMKGVLAPQHFMSRLPWSVKVLSKDTPR